MRLPRPSAAAALLTLPALSCLAQPSFRLIQPDATHDYAVVQDVAKTSPLVLVSLQNSSSGPALFGCILNRSDGVRTNIADPFGSDLNPIAISTDGGVVAGSLGGGPLANQDAFVWTSGNGVQNIGGLQDGNVSYATGVSGDGSVVVGTTGANFGDPYQQGWRWTPANGFSPLTDVGNDILIFGSAEDISADGLTIVGTGSIGDFDPDTDDLASAVIWPNGGTTPTDLGNLPGPFATGGTLPFAASSDGSVVVGFGPGYSDSGNFANRGFRWTAATGFVDIGSLPSNPDGSIYITDCSSDGDTLVGFMIDGGVNTWEAVVWTAAAGVRTLRDILNEQGVTVAANIRLRETFCNGDATVIGGWAYDTNVNRYRGYIATINPPDSCACPADFDCDGFVTGLDFDTFVADFEEGNPSADFDSDGFITGLDFDAYVAAFEAGC